MGLIAVTGASRAVWCLSFKGYCKCCIYCALCLLLLHIASGATAMLDGAEKHYWWLNDWEGILYCFVQVYKSQTSDLLRILVSWILTVFPAMVFMGFVS